VMGAIDLDPCSCARAQRTVKAKNWYCKKQNGLIQPWFGRVWCNPPGDRAGKLVQAFWRAAWASDMSEMMWLCFNISHLRTLQPRVNRCHVCVLSKRIAFTGPSPTRDNAALYYGPNAERFVRLMQPHGTIWQPMLDPGAGSV